jgi:AbrB family looped-hinge helix DNA binding protein
VQKTRLSSKGQVIIPKAVRDAHEWRTGQEFVVIDTEDGVLLKEQRPFTTTELVEVAGVLKRPERARTLEEMEEAIAEGVRAKQDDSG